MSHVPHMIASSLTQLAAPSNMSPLQPIADRVAQHFEIISKNFQSSTRPTRILMGFIIYFLVLIVNPMGRILIHWKSFRNNLEMLCHPICNWLCDCASHASDMIESCLAQAQLAACPFGQRSLTDKM